MTSQQFMENFDMKIKNLIDQDIVNYKKTCMFISVCYCDFKCCKQLGLDVCICQNSPIAQSAIVQVQEQKLIDRYLNNNLSHSIVFGGLQPFLQFEQVKSFIQKFREKSLDDIVIYTGYYKDQIKSQIQQLKEFKNIIIKYGRFIPNGTAHFDQVLGVFLANKQQYAQKIS